MRDGAAPFIVEHHPLRRHKRGNEEGKLQADLVRLLNVALRKGWVFFSVPNNPRSAVTGAHLKAAGMRAGVSDLIFVAPPHGRCYGLELKADKGRQSDEQKAFARDLDAAGGKYALARGMDEAIAVLKSWGALRLVEERAS